MKLSLFATSFVALAAVLSLAGCSGEDGEIAVDPASAPLTSGPNDPLFTIRVVDAPAEGYALDGLTVKATPAGRTAITIAAKAADTNGNGKLDKGETLVCTEGAVNALDATVGGTDVEIELYAKVDGKDTKVGSASWTPPAAK